MTSIAWQATARCEEYDYLIRASDCHRGTYTLRIADGQTNVTVYRANDLHSVVEALEAAELWRCAHMEVEHDTEG